VLRPSVDEAFLFKSLPSHIRHAGEIQKSMNYRQYSYREYQERPRNRLRSTLIFVTALVWVLVLACLALRFFVRPNVTDYVNRQVAVTIDPQIPPSLDPNAALRESLSQIPLGGAIPPGRFEVTEEMANDYLYAYRQNLGEIDAVQVNFVPGEIEANISLRRFPLSGTATTTPAVQDGRLIATNTRLNQPLDSVLSIDPLMNALLSRINEEVAAQGRRITAVEITDGLAIVSVE
jgi:hypothetical protein